MFGDQGKQKVVSQFHSNVMELSCIMRFMPDYEQLVENSCSIGKCRGLHTRISNFRVPL